MAGVVRTGEGTTLSYSSDGGTTYIELVNITSIQPPGFSRPAVSTKHLKSASATKRPGKIPDYGDVALHVLYKVGEASHTTLLAMATDLVLYKWKIEYFDETGTAAGTDVFDGFVTEVGPDQVEDEANHGCDVTLAVAGPVTRT